MFSDTENQLIDEYFAFAKTLVKSAGELVKEGYSKSNDDLGIVEKEAKWDMVTDYDKKTEAFLINAISAKYPEHKWVFRLYALFSNIISYIKISSETVAFSKEIFRI